MSKIELETGQVPWTLADALIGIAALISVSILMGIAVYAGAVSLGFLVGAKIPSYLSVVFYGGSMFAAEIGLAWWLGIIRRGGTAANLGFTDVRFRFDLPIAIMGQVIIFIGLSTYGMLLFELAGKKVPEQPVVKLFGSSPVGFFLAAIFIVVLGPLGEEVFFRGFVYTAFRGRWGSRTAMVAGSAVFALFHIHPLLYIPMFIIGMVLAAVFEYRRSLAPNILLHSLNNLAALLIYYRGIG